MSCSCSDTDVLHRETRKWLFYIQLICWCNYTTKSVLSRYPKIIKWSIRMYVLGELVRLRSVLKVKFSSCCQSEISSKSNDPSTRPHTEFLCKPIRRIMEEKSMTRNHEGEIIGRGIIEKGSLREASGRHLGGSRRL